jgi:hypothetical protein
VLVQVLESYSKDQPDLWTELTDLPAHAKALKALPIILIHWGVAENFDVECTHRYTYVGLRTRMLSFALQFVPLTIPRYQSAIGELLKSERRRVEEVLERPITELRFNELIGEVDVKVYEP